MKGVLHALILTSHDHRVQDSGSAQHGLDVAPVAAESSSSPTLWVQQQHQTTRTGKLALQQPCTQSKTRISAGPLIPLKPFFALKSHLKSASRT